MKVAVYHPFSSFPDNYSLSHVVKEQLRMLTEHGVATYFVTSKNFKGEDPEGVSICWVDNPYLKNMDYIFTHDIVYLPPYRKYDEQLRKIKGPKFLHWIHSAPNPKDKREPFPNSIYIGMNYTDLPLLAEQFQVPIAKCRVVYNPVSPDVFFDWHPFTSQIISKYELLDTDVLAVYPLDTGRFEDKGGHKIIKLVEHIRKQGKNAKVVFVNAAANDPKRRKNVETWVKNKSEYVVFSSREDKQYEVYTPRRVVRELMQLSNLFPLLSSSEGCSLTLLEAGLSKNLIILNEDFPPLREFGGLDKALYMKVSSTRAQTKYNPSEDNYYRDWATYIVSELENNKVNLFNRHVLRRFNRGWIWKNQLEPLLR